MNATLNLRSAAATTRGLLVDGITAWMARLAIRLRRAVRHQALGADELRAMSELDLKDLGIGRSEIPHALHGPGGFWECRGGPASVPARKGAGQRQLSEGPEAL